MLVDTVLYELWLKVRLGEYGCRPCPSPVRRLLTGVSDRRDESWNTAVDQRRCFDMCDLSNSRLFAIAEGIFIEV